MQPIKQGQLLDPAVAFTEIPSTIAAQRWKNAKTDIVKGHIDDMYEDPDTMRTKVVEETRPPIQLVAASPVGENQSVFTASENFPTNY